MSFSRKSTRATVNLISIGIIALAFNACGGNSSTGGDIKQIQARTVDFGASDSPMKDEDLKAAPGEILHIPTVLGAVVITYNLSGVSQPLHFSPDVVADIFLGKIKKWNDARIKADNTSVSLS